MPTYDYRCDECGHKFQAFHGMTEAKPCCEKCNGNTSLAFDKAPAVHGAHARGREQAMRSLPECGSGCRCCP